MVIIFQFCGSQSLAKFSRILAFKKKLLFSKKSQNFSNFCCCHSVKICQIKHTLIIALVFVRFCHITDWTKGQTYTQPPLLYFQEGLELMCKRTQQLRLLPVNLCQFCSPVILDPPDISLGTNTKTRLVCSKVDKERKVSGYCFLNVRKCIHGYLLLTQQNG